MDIVKEVLNKQAKEAEKYKSINVTKHEEVKIDLGHLLISDPNNFDESELKENADQYLLNLTRDNVQLLVNGIWELPTERLDEHIVAKLPKPTFALPRARKLPVPKPLTKWEQFAKAKGIKKTTRDKKVYDTELDKWVPRYGYQKFKAEQEKDWVLEVPQNLDPMTDMFQKKKDLKNERVAKNEIARMKNIARAQKVQIPRAGFVTEESASAKELHVAATIAKASTASVGKFQEKLPKEKEARGIGIKELIPGSKRKRTVDPKMEKSEQLDVVKKILNKRPRIDVDKAVQIQKREAREEREKNPVEKKKGGSKSKHAKKFSSKKPKGAMGNRKPKKGGAGRKRR